MKAIKNLSKNPETHVGEVLYASVWEGFKIKIIRGNDIREGWPWRRTFMTLIFQGEGNNKYVRIGKPYTCFVIYPKWPWQKSRITHERVMEAVEDGKELLIKLTNNK